MAEEQDALNYANSLTGKSPAETALLKKLRGSAGAADQGVLDQQAALKERGDNLANVSDSDLNATYEPAYERLMNSYKTMDSGILEDMNKRGIMSEGSSADNGTGVAGSEPEAYQRMLLGRDTKENLGRNMLDAQNQVVNQKLQQYQARLGETNQANTRYDQTMTPYIAATVTPAATRMGVKADAANSHLGYTAQQHATDVGQHIAGQDRTWSAIGGALGAAGGIGSAFAFSDENMKKDIHEAEAPEEALSDIDKLHVQKWKYKMGGGEHEGAMAQDMPGDLSPDGKTVDIVSYLGKLTGAVQGLNKKVNKYDQLLAQGA